MTRPTALLVLMMAPACVTGGAKDTVDSSDPPCERGADEPWIEVEPSEYDFSEVAVDEEWEQFVEFTVDNLGDADLHIQNIELEDPSQPFDLFSISTVLIRPEQHATFDLRFDPETEGPYATAVLIETDDSCVPSLRLEVTGQGVAE